jgi:methylenetetrahydrofolate reductase (NADPH)
VAFLRRGSPGSRLAPGPRAALAGVLASPTFELIPLRNAVDLSAAIPEGSTVSVTASPARGLEATVELSVALEAAGFRAVPHLSARQVRDRDHLRTLLGRLRDAGVDRAFVVGGDAVEPGDYADGLSLLQAIADLGMGPREIGIGCYPQGHPIIPDDVLLRALREKAPFASYMTTQLCFDAPAIARFIAARRAEGISLPVKIGIPGVAEVAKLMAISARIGVRDTRRFLLKNTRFVGQLLTSGGVYRPTGLLENLAPLIAEPGAGVIGLHLYTFNQVASTEAWRRDLLVALSEPAEVAAPA